MVESFLGLTVTRSIPSEVVTGLMTGQYKLHGGVIRWAASTEYAGQIVGHLLPFSQIESLGQINALAATTQQVLQIATGTMVMAGLNLAVTTLGFAVFNEKLKNLEGKLN